MYVIHYESGQSFKVISKGLHRFSFTILTLLNQFASLGSPSENDPLVLT